MWFGPMREHVGSLNVKAVEDSTCRDSDRYLIYEPNTNPTRD